ncbi:aminoacyl-tRNA hydrolase [Kitasatospora purpeofusca]|uniref:aminoacyl-tRNA hydrolase n=1 Tax=Kitasatospora purpeofusca TaxID=67352 RepID=UPI0036A6044D
MTSPFDAPVPDPTPEDRDARQQYVLPLVVRMERATPPGRTDALETSARVVLTLLNDPRVVEPEGEWAERVLAWEDARIRKVVRRARGGEWRRAGELPGITVTGLEAEVRVFPPVPLDGWPKELAKLQVSGTDLEEAGPVGAATPGVPVLWLNPELEMSAGKTMAQTGHAAQLAWWRLDDARRKEWAESGFALAVRTATPQAWAELVVSGLPLVQDAGFTEIAPGSCTVVADHPALRG